MRLTKNKLLFVTCLFSFAFYDSKAQDDLLKLAQSSAQSSEPINVAETFKSSKIINAQTTEMLKKRTLDFRVGHRFGNIGAESGGGFKTFYGLDNASDIRIAFEYGVSDNLTLGVSRNKINQNFEGFFKYKILAQKEQKMPVSVALFASSVMSATSDNSDYDKFAHRLTYAYQVVVARKFTHSLSLLIIPSFVHRNFVSDSKDLNNIYSIGAGGRLKVSKRSAIIADYFFVPDRKNTALHYHNALGLGWEIETGGHVFSVMFTNSSGIVESEFIGNTTDKWTKGGFKFGFNISRVFQL